MPYRSASYATPTGIGPNRRERRNGWTPSDDNSPDAFTFGQRCRLRVVEQSADASRRTHLANERTYLAWLRSGLAALAVAIATGGVVPDLISGPGWPFLALGVAFALLGVMLIAFGFVRQHQVERALAHGEYSPLDERITLVLTLGGCVLGVGTIIAIVFAT